MNIGTATEMTKLPAKTIRYYDDISLIKPARAKNGYRNYSQTDVHRLRFVQRARSLGFAIEECRTLISLYDDDDRASSAVKSIALEKIDQIDLKIAELKTLRSTLASLAKNCKGDNKPNCPILDDLSGKNIQ